MHAGHQLESSANDFERGHTDDFTFKTPDLGELQKLLISSDGRGLGSDWFLESVSIRDSKRLTSVLFPYSNWLNNSNGLEQVCQPVRVPYLVIH